MQSPVLYFSRNPNPRLAVAVARHLRVDVHLQWAAPFDPAQSDRFRLLNPTLRIPILVEPGAPPLWEADAIACRLSQMAGSDFWRMGRQMPEMIRWISWGKETFVRACDEVHFQRGTRARYRLGPLDAEAVTAGLARFHDSAMQLNDHLTGRDFLLDDGLSHADFRMATFLPFNDAARLPLSDYKAITAWLARLDQIAAWADPFDSLAAPPLPDIPDGA